MLACLLLQNCFAQNMYTNLTNDIVVNGMAQDGPSLWFATGGGLYKYDTLTGNTVKFDKTNSPLYSNEFSTVKMAAKGKIVMIPRASTWQSYDEDTGWTPEVFNGFVNAQDAVGDGLGRVWVAGPYSILFFDGQQTQILDSIDGISLMDLYDQPYCTVDYNTNTAWIYFYNARTLFKCDTLNHWTSYTVPHFSRNDLLLGHVNRQSNFVYTWQSAFYVLNQPAGKPNAAALIKFENGSWSSIPAPVITDPNDYFIHLQLMPDSSVRIPHGYVNEITGAYYYGVYVYANNRWTEEDHISGTFPFKTDSTQQNYAFIDADATGNMYYGYGFDPTNEGDRQHASGLWKLSSDNRWTRLKTSNANFVSDDCTTGYVCMDTAGTIYSLHGNQLDRLMPDDTVINSIINLCMDSVRVNGATLDSNNNLWVSVYTLNNFSPFLINTSDCSIYPYALILSQLTYYKGVIYCAARGPASTEDLVKFDIYNHTFSATTCIPPPQWSPAFNGLTAIFPHDSVIYALAANNYPILLRYDHGFLTEPLPAQTACNGLVFDTLGHPWASVTTNTHGGGIGTTVIYRLDDTTWNEVRSFPGIPWGPVSIAVDKKNVITTWTDSGTYRFQNGIWDSFPPTPSFMYSISMFPRNDGSVVFALAEDGMIIFKPRLPTPPTPPIPVVDATILLNSVVYPNPNKGTFNISFTKDPAEPYNIRLTDITGRLVYQTQSTGVKTTVSCPHLSAGVYTWQIILSNYKSTGKIVIL